MSAEASPTPSTSTALATRSGTQGASKRTRSPRLPEKDRSIRQELVLMRTICGTKAQQIAKELQISVATVKTDLQAARQSSMVAAARDQLVGMIPKALAVLDTHLDSGDKDVALVVLEGLGIIGKHMQVSMLPAMPNGAESYEVFRARVIGAKPSTDPPPAANRSERSAFAGPVIDATTA